MRMTPNCAWAQNTHRTFFSQSLIAYAIRLEVSLNTHVPFYTPACIIFYAITLAHEDTPPKKARASERRLARDARRKECRVNLGYYVINEQYRTSLDFTIVHGADVYGRGWKPV
jgi:hypothetical protein